DLDVLVYVHPKYMRSVNQFEEIIDSLGIKTVLGLGEWKWFLLAKSLVLVAEKEKKFGDVYKKSERELKLQLDDEYKDKTFQEIIELPCTIMLDLPGRIAGLIERELGHITIRDLAHDALFDNAAKIVEEWRNNNPKIMYSHESFSGK